MHRFIATAIMVAVLATGCGGSAGGDDVASSSNASAAAEGPQSFEDLEFRSPIAEFLGQDAGMFEFDEAAMIEQQREAERAIAACMADKGFEYTPVDAGQMMIFSGPPGDLDPGSAEWVAKYGFGISTQRFPQSMVGDLVGFPDEQFAEAEQEFVDPNQDYVESLSEGERDAYFEALYGIPPEFGPEGPDEDFMFEPSGCQADAFMSGPGGFENGQAFYQAFNDQLETLQDRVEADPRIVAFNAEISSCVADRGMDWTGMDDIYEQFEPRLSDLEPDFSGDPFEAAGLDPEQMTEREMDDFFRELNRLSPESLAILAQVQADEIALAQAVTECGGGLLRQQQLMIDVRAEYEQQFLDENADALAEFAPDN